jgi:hypothetical protein
MLQSLSYNLLHLALAVAGFALVATIARSRHADRWLWPGTIAASALMFATLLLLSDPATWFEDFRKAYWKGGAAVWQGPDALAGIFEQAALGFVNLPIVAVLFAPFGLFPEKIGAALFSLLAFCAIPYLWRAGSLMFGLTRTQSALAMFALAAFGPLAHSVKQGNTSHVLLALALWALMLVRGDRRVAAGLVLGLAALIKPPFLLFGVYFLFRRDWRVALGGASAIVGGAVLSLLIFGWELHVAWYQSCIEPFLGGVVAAFNAQSLASVFARYELGPSVLWNWEPHHVSAAVKAPAYVMSIVLVGLGAWASLIDARNRLERDVAVVLVLLCLVSTLSWTHYFVWLTPAFAVLMVASAEAHAPRWLRPSLIVAYALSAPMTFLSEPMRAARYPFTLELVSHLAAGALLTISLLFVVRFRDAARASAMTSRPAAAATA